ncbi:MAG: hypothetical protein Q9222_005187 [Ikaeria aurantiellina]
MPSSRYRPPHAKWLPDADDVLSWQEGHTPLLNLKPCMFLRDSNRQHPQYAEYVRRKENALQSWRNHNDRMLEWQSGKSSPAARGREGPILPFESGEPLGAVFSIFDRYFFNGELEPQVRVQWVDGLSNNALGRTMWLPVNDGLVIDIKRPLGFERLEGFCSALGTLEICSTLLHEMCHAYLEVKLCRCPKCEEVPLRLGRGGHGNPWLQLAWLVEEANGELRNGGHRFNLGIERKYQNEVELEEKNRRAHRR